MAFFSKAKLASLLLFAVTCAICLVAVEFVLRWRYPDKPAAVTEEVRQVQAHLKLHPKLGYTWKENIALGDNIVLKVSDTQLDTLSTDRWGFINPPEAIAGEQSGNAVGVIGLGDSFMEHGSFLFRTLFKQAGLAYYNMAIHRQCPPQYNIILNDYALPKKPTWIIYGLFENDFDETEDFERWTTSGMDWFTYHSGTWCGRPVTASSFERFVHSVTPGYYVTYRRALEKLKWDNPRISKSLATDPAKVADYVRAAHAAAKQGGVRFLLILIPSKITSLTGRSADSGQYDALLGLLAADAIDTLDLRPVFRLADHPESLYYPIDGHWNRNGISTAATAILAHIQTDGGHA